MKRTLILMTLVFATVGAYAQTNDTNEVRYDQYGKIVDRIPLSAENRNGVLVFESKAQDYKLWYDARVQTDAGSSCS